MKRPTAGFFSASRDTQAATLLLSPRQLACRQLDPLPDPDDVADLLGLRGRRQPVQPEAPLAVAAMPSRDRLLGWLGIGARPLI
jgi:hypothetical protein